MKEYLNQVDAARRLGISKQRIQVLLKAHRLRGTLIGGWTMIAAAEVERFAKLPPLKPGRKKV